MKSLTIRILLRRIRNIKNYLKDPDASKMKKLLIIFGIIYLLSPLDLIPAPVLGFSIIDDLVLWLFILIHLAEELDKYGNIEHGLSRRDRKRYKGMKIMDGEAVVIDDEDDANETESGGID